MTEKSDAGFIAWYAVVILTAANLVSTTDRQILTLLVEPIRNDLHITDTQFSLLGGFAFALFYTFFGLPIAYVADRKSRRVIISTGITVWSLMTAFCGLAGNFMQLFLARIGVGIGEASLGPAAQSMIADYFPPHKLGRAIGVFTIGSSMGSGLALIFGATVFEFVAGLPPVTVPVAGLLKPWQLAFLSVGLPGLLIAGLMMTVAEPQRSQPAGTQIGLPHETDRTDTDPGLLRFLVINWKLYLPLLSGFSLVLLTLHANLMWLPAFFIRVFEWEIGKSGTVLGSILLLFGVLGAVTGGLLADHLRAEGILDAPLKMILVAIIITIPFGGTMPLSSNPVVCVVLLSGFIMPLWSIGVLFPTALLLITPNHFRAQVAALSFFMGNMIGMGIGPTAVAVITDYVFADGSSVGYSLALVTIMSLTMALLILNKATGHYSDRINNL